MAITIQLHPAVRGPRGPVDVCAQCVTTFARTCVRTFASGPTNHTATSCECQVSGRVHRLVYRHISTHVRLRAHNQGWRHFGYYISAITFRQLHFGHSVSHFGYHISAITFRPLHFGYSWRLCLAHVCTHGHAHVHMDAHLYL